MIKLYLNDQLKYFKVLNLDKKYFFNEDNLMLKEFMQYKIVLLLMKIYRQILIYRKFHHHIYIPLACKH
jgi:hypothetical protein